MMEKNILSIRYFVKNGGIFHGKVLYLMEVYIVMMKYIKKDSHTISTVLSENEHPQS